MGEQGASQLSPYIDQRLTTICGTPLDEAYQKRRNAPFLAQTAPTSSGVLSQSFRPSTKMKPFVKPVIAKPWDTYQTSSAALHALQKSYPGVARVGAAATDSNVEKPSIDTSRVLVVRSNGMRLDRFLNVLDSWYWPFDDHDATRPRTKAYSPRSLIVREALFCDPTVSQTLDQISDAMFIASRVKARHMKQPQYIVLFSKLYRCLVNDRLPSSNSDLKDVVRRDWDADRLGKVSISKPHLRRLLFQLADLWTTGITAKEYSAFLQRVTFAIIEMNHLKRCRTTYRFRDDKYIRHYDPMTLMHASRKARYFHCKLPGMKLNEMSETYQENARTTLSSRSPPKSAPHRGHATKTSTPKTRLSPPSTNGTFTTLSANKIGKGLLQLKVGLPSTSVDTKLASETSEQSLPGLFKLEASHSSSNVPNRVNISTKTQGSQRTFVPAQSISASSTRKGFILEPCRPESNPETDSAPPTIRIAMAKSRTPKEVRFICHSMGLSPRATDVHQLDGIRSSQNYTVDVNKMWQTRIKKTQIDVAARSRQNNLSVFYKH